MIGGGREHNRKPKIIIQLTRKEVAEVPTLHSHVNYMNNTESWMMNFLLSQ